MSFEIVKAWQLVERGYSRGFNARTEDGTMVHPGHRLATRFCAVGAINAAYTDLDEYMLAMRAVKERVGKAICAWSDRAGQEEVVRVLKELDV